MHDVGIRFNGVSPAVSADITGNTLKTIGAGGTGFLSGIAIDHFGTGSVSDNDISSISGGFGLGIEATFTTTISGNRISGVFGGNGITFPGAGLLLNTNGIGATDNYLTGNAIGVAVGSSVSSGTVVTGNCIDGNTSAGLANGSSSAVNATGNWWGCPTGANTVGCDTAINTGGGSFTASPFAASPTCSDCGSPRYVATTGSDTDNHCLNSLTPCATVQHGVDEACDGNTVQVDAGTYPEQIVIAKPLTVIGAGKNLTILKPNSVAANTTSLSSGNPIAPIVLVNGVTTAPGVSLNQFSVDGTTAAFNSCLPGYVGVYYRNGHGAADNLHVTHVFHPSAPGCQAVIGILVQSGGGGSAAADISNTDIDNYGKNGITCNEANTTCNVTDSTITGRGPVPPNDAAQNGVQIAFGAAGSIVGNQIHDNFYSPQTVCSSGVLALSDGLTIQGNVIDGNLCDLVAQTDLSDINGNVIDPAGPFPVSLYGNGNNVTLNVVSGSPNSGFYVDGDNNTFTCNRVTNTGGGFYFDNFSTAGTPNELHNNSIFDNGVGIDASVVVGPPNIDATSNWWGCIPGPGNPGCDTVTGPVDTTTPLAAPAPCVSCSSNSDCDDTLACNGAETCNAGMCVAGTPVNCLPFADQCNDSACAEPGGTCPLTPKPDGFGCDDGNHCTTNDTCQTGVCNGGLVGTGDADGDGYCDVQETQAGCDPNDGQEIPPQPNVFSGARTNSRGEVLLTFRAPAQRIVKPSTDPSCATVGTCNLLSGFCNTGKVGDPCSTNSQCDQPAGTCRLVVNYNATSDLALVFARQKRFQQPTTDIAASFPLAPGCSRKVDIDSLTTGFKRAKIKLKVTGTTSGKLRRDRDRITFRE